MQGVRLLRDDVRLLSTLEDDRYDLVVCQLALMVLPDIDATFGAVHRVMKSVGRFVAALLHPCFEMPFQVPSEPVEADGAGRFRHHRVQRYFDH